MIHIDIHDLEPLPTYVKGGVTVLGDAAHAMSRDRDKAPDPDPDDALPCGAEASHRTATPPGAGAHHPCPPVPARADRYR